MKRLKTKIYLLKATSTTSNVSLYPTALSMPVYPVASYLIITLLLFNLLIPYFPLLSVVVDWSFQLIVAFSMGLPVIAFVTVPLMLDMVSPYSLAGNRYIL